MAEQLPSTDQIIAWGQQRAAAIKASHKAVGDRLRAQEATWLADHPPPRPHTQTPTGEVYDAVTKEWINPLTGNRRRDASTWVPDPDQGAINTKLATLRLSEPDVRHALNGDTNAIEPIRVLLPPAPPGTLLLMENTNLERRFIRVPQDVNPGAAAIAHPAEQPPIPVLPEDFDLQTADDYEICCFLWLKLTQYDRFTLASFQQYCRAVFGIGLQKAKRLHHYLRDCGSLFVSVENRPRRPPIRWYWRAARPPTRLPDEAEADDI